VAYPSPRLDAAWQDDLELKLFTAIRCVRLCVPPMRRVGGGRIVNILNTGAKTPAARSLPTSVSRAAGLTLTKTLSKELAPDGILVNAICLGLVAREREVPVGRIGEAEELGALVAFLVSAQAAFITGVAVNFDGGHSAVV